MGRHDDAHALFERLLALRNEVGLLAEEYDPTTRLLGNFPQAFSHTAIINTAATLTRASGPAQRRADRHRLLALMRPRWRHPHLGWAVRAYASSRH